jgi:hypothetical protein
MPPRGKAGKTARVQKGRIGAIKVERRPACWLTASRHRLGPGSPELRSRMRALPIGSWVSRPVVDGVNRRQRRPAPMSYWQSSFPNRYEFRMDLDDAQIWHHDSQVKHKGKIARECFVSFQRVGTRGASRKALLHRFRKLVSADGETIRARHFNFVGFAWDSRVNTGPPVGFVTFDIRLEYTRGGRIKTVTFEPDLIYVAKANRGRHLSRLFAASFEIWFHACKVYGVRVANGGVVVRFDSEYETKGGRALGDLIAGHFEAMQDMVESGLTLPRDLGWHIKDFDNDADPMTNEFEELIRIQASLERDRAGRNLHRANEPK